MKKVSIKLKNGQSIFKTCENSTAAIKSLCMRHNITVGEISTIAISNIK